MMIKHVYSRPNSDKWYVRFIDKTGKLRRITTHIPHLGKKQPTQAELKTIQSLLLEKSVESPVEVKYCPTFREFATKATIERGSKYNYTANDVEIFLSGKSDRISILKKENAISNRFKYRSAQTFFLIVRSLIAYFGEKPVNEISMFDVSDFVEYLKSKGKAANTINNRLNTLSALYDWGQMVRDFENLNMLSPIRRKKHIQRNTSIREIRYMSFEEEERFHAVCKKQDSPHWFPLSILSDIVIFQIFSGLRINETLNIKVYQFQKDVLSIGDKSKSQKQNVISFSHPVIQQIREKYCTGKKDSDYVFTWKDKQIEYTPIKKSFHRACSAAKIENLKIHDLRRTAARRWYDGTNYSGKKHDIMDVRRLLKHSDVKTTMLYIGAV